MELPNKGSTQRLQSFILMLGVGLMSSKNMITSKMPSLLLALVNSHRLLSLLTSNLGEL